MNKDSLVTIVLPVYNVESYIELCLKSIVRQTYRNIEILCINDLSLDNSVSIIKKFMETDSRIRLFHHNHNKGLGAARNTGIGLARGEFICFVDSDDYIQDDYVESLLSSLLRANSQMAFSSINIEDQARKTTETHSTFHRLELMSELELCKTFNVKNNDEIIFNLFPSAWNKIYLKEVIQENNIFFPEGILYEDHFFYFKYIYAIEKVSYVDKPLYIYRTNRPGQITAINNKKIYDIFNVLDQLSCFLSERIPKDQYGMFFPMLSLRLLWERTCILNYLDPEALKFILQSRSYLKKFNISLKDGHIKRRNILICNKAIFVLNFLYKFSKTLFRTVLA